LSYDPTARQDSRTPAAGAAPAPPEGARTRVTSGPLRTRFEVFRWIQSSRPE